MYPSRHQSLHTLTEGIFESSDMSAANDVRVTSCSPDFGKKIGVRENRRHEYSFKDRTNWFEHNMQIDHGC